MAERGAGASANERAEQQRQKAERLLAAAARNEKGAQGEVAVATVLKQLPPIYTVLHDLQVPGSKANIDHLVIGPAGVFVVDAKHWSQPLRVSDGMIWRGRHPIRKELDTVAWEAEQASVVLGVPVHPMLCFVGPILPTAVVDLPPVRVTNDSALVATILTGQAGYVLDDISRITLLAHRHLPPATNGPGVRPTSTQPGARSRRTTTRAQAPRRPAAGGRRAKSRTTKHSILGSLAMLVVAALLALNAGTISNLLNELLPKASDILPPVDAAPSPTPTLNGDFACPAAGAGWTLTFRWPGDGAPGGYTLATSADLATWTPFATWTSSAQTAPSLPGVAPDTAVTVRTTAAGDATSPPIDGTFRSPAGAC